MDDSICTLFFALAASVILIYLLPALQFNSLFLPLAIPTVPLGLFSLFLLDSTVMLGLISFHPT